MNNMEKEENELKKHIEALLFSAVKGIKLEEIAKLCNTRDLEKIRDLIEDLKKEYDEKDSSLMIVSDSTNSLWKFAVREKHLKVVRKAITKTELTKTLMETLAVIAHKAPVKQSDVIRIRTNKAYDQIRDLTDKGYITSEKFGKTKLLKLSTKFYEYFDATPEMIKQKLERFDQLEQQINKEEESIKAKTQVLRPGEEEKQEKENIIAENRTEEEKDNNQNDNRLKDGHKNKAKEEDNHSQ